MNGHVLASVSAQGVEYTFTHDANGNMTHGPDLANFAQPGSRDIAYNADDMPLSITDVRGGVPVTTSFLYDGGASRARKTVSGGPTTWYFGDHYEVTNGVATKFIFAGSLRVASITGQDRWSFQNDHLGSSTLVTGPTGAVVEHTEYRPFGQERSHTGQQTDNYKYTGQELDSENGLYNYGARLYDPILGRFLPADAVVKDFSDPQTLNRYSYVRNNPLIYTDPSGNVFVLDDFLIGAAQGAAIGAVIGGVTAAVMGGDIGQGMVSGAIGGALFNMAGSIIAAYHIGTVGAIGMHAAAGAASGGIDSAIFGGDIGQGMVTGGISGGVGKFIGGGIIGRTLAGGVSGGISAELYGGSFGEGFILGAKTAFIGAICNEGLHMTQDAQKILNTFRGTVDNMTESGQRTPFSWGNNASRTLNWLTLGLLGSPYLGCGQQADVVTRELEKNSYDSNWDFEVKAGFDFKLPHQWGEAVSNNPSDPLIKYDPWKDRIEFRAR